MTIPSLGLSRVGTSGRAPPGADLGGRWASRSSSNGRRTPPTATSPRTSPSAARRRQGGRRASWRRSSRRGSPRSRTSSRPRSPGRVIDLRLANSFFVGALGEVGDAYGGGWAADAPERVQVEMVPRPNGAVVVSAARNGAYGDSARGCAVGTVPRVQTTTAGVRRHHLDLHAPERCLRRAAARCCRRRHRSRARRQWPSFIVFYWLSRMGLAPGFPVSRVGWFASAALCSQVTPRSWLTQRLAEVHTGCRPSSGSEARLLAR